MAGKVSQTVLVVEDAERRQNVEQLHSSISKEASIIRRDCNSLKKGDLESSAYDFVAYDLKNTVNTSAENYLAECFRVLKPGGRILIHKNVEKDCIADKIVSSLKLCGFLDVTETRDLVEAVKPTFEIGSSVKLSFIKNGPSNETLKKWQLAVDEYSEGNENDLIDDNELLDEADFIKPDPESLRVCGTTGKRKACANCTCGLAEELNNAEISSVRQNTQQAKSSCGSCYLGDAFRCADCPYIGLPAFKPGEKVIIDNSSDI